MVYVLEQRKHTKRGRELSVTEERIDLSEAVARASALLECDEGSVSRRLEDGRVVVFDGKLSGAGGALKVAWRVVQ